MPVFHVGFVSGNVRRMNNKCTGQLNAVDPVILWGNLLPTVVG